MPATQSDKGLRVVLEDTDVWPLLELIIEAEERRRFYGGAIEEWPEIVRLGDELWGKVCDGMQDEDEVDEGP